MIRRHASSSARRPSGSTATGAGDPPQNGPRPPGIHLIFVAAAIARLPGLPLPAIPIQEPAPATEEPIADER